MTSKRLRAGPVLALAFTLVSAFLVVAVSYGMAREYGDTSATDTTVATRALEDWGIGVIVVAGLAALVVVTARLSRGRRALTSGAVAAIALTLLAVPAVAVVGVHRKFASFPEVPRCTAGFSSGPAVPVVRAAQAAFEELDHPGPFSGGGESGLGGCASELMLRPGHVDVSAAYRDTLRTAGWQLDRVEADRVEASRDGQRFSAGRDRHGAWWVRIGPETDLR